MSSLFVDAGRIPRALRVLLLIIVLVAPGVPVTADDSAAMSVKDIYGWIEPVKVTEQAVLLPAKLDTGADTSSLDARDAKRFERDGVEYVRFDLVHSSHGAPLTLEYPVTRDALIRRHGREPDRRPVVALRLCLGNIEREIEFTLADRGVFDYPVLLGRNALEGIGVIDPDARDTTRPDCG